MFTKGLGSNGYNDNSSKGRFPANILMSCSCDYQLKSGIIKEDKKKLLDWLYENT